MRKISMGGWVLFGGLVGLGTIVSACSSDASTAAISPNVNFENPEFDGGTVAPGFDGSSDVGGDDAGTGPDSATSVDAAGLPATITVLSGKTPVTTATVVFQHADGTVIDSVVTNASGQASYTAEPDMMATIVNPPANTLTTFVGVKANDQLVVDDTDPLAASHSVAITLQPVVGEKLYTANAGDCATSSKGITAFALGTVAGACLNQKDQTVPVLVRSAGIPPFSWAILPKLPIATSGDTAADFTKLAGGGWTSTYDTLTATIANAGPASGIGFYLRGVAGGVAFTQPFVTPAYTGNTANVVQANVPHAFDAAQLDVTSATILGSNVAVSVIGKRFTGVTVAEDGTRLLPQITASLVDSSTVARPRVTWSSSAPLTATDGGFVRLYWSVGKILSRWNFIVPPGTTEVKAPVLPAALQSYAPPSASLSVPQIVFIESDQVADYDAFRTSGAHQVFAGTVPSNGLQSGSSFLPSVVGTVRATAYAVRNN